MSEVKFITQTEIIKLLIKNQLIVHTMFGLPVVGMILYIWEIPLTGYPKLALYYLFVMYFVYFPIFLSIAYFILKPSFPYLRRALHASKIELREANALIHFYSNLPSKIQIYLSCTIFLAYAFSAYLFSQGLIPELMPHIAPFIFATISYGLIMTITESYVNSVSLTTRCNQVIEDILNNVQSSILINTINKESDSLHNKIRRALFVTNITTLLMTLVFFVGVVYIFIPFYLPHTILFTLGIIFINLLYLSRVGNLFATNLLNSIENIEQWISQAAQGTLEKKTVYTNDKEIIPITDSTKKLLEKLDAKNKALEDERNNLRNILANISDGVIVARRSGAILYLNKRAKEILSVDISLRNVRLSLNLLFRPSEGTLNKTINTWQDIFTSPEEIKNHKIHIYSLSGNKLLVSLSVQKLETTENPTYVLAFSDITKDEELEQMKADFVSIAAHELRTPLTSVRNYLSVVSEELDPNTSEDIKIYLERTKASAEQLAEIMESFLTASKIERNAMTLNKENTDWATLITQTVEKFHILATDKGIKINFYPAADIPSPIPVDTMRMQEVLNNLIDNAIKYTPKGEVVIRVAVNRESRTIHTSISDQGIGIPSDQLDRIFTKFFRAKNATEVGIKGTGIGLYITKTIIELHGGTISVDSKQNEGTTFTFTLPY
jgi:two-component system sensor histidine kinase VicK